jgi:hypothetical protein
MGIAWQFAAIHISKFQEAISNFFYSATMKACPMSPEKKVISLTINFL